SPTCLSVLSVPHRPTPSLYTLSLHDALPIYAGMAEPEERRVIARTVATIQHVTGKPPLGWHTRSAASPNTRRLLVEQGGFLYDRDRKSTRLNSSHDQISYAVFCLKKKK